MDKPGGPCPAGAHDLAGGMRQGSPIAKHVVESGEPPGTAQSPAAGASPWNGPATLENAYFHFQVSELLKYMYIPLPNPSGILDILHACKNEMI